jgi:hypothetical protein
MYGSICSRLYSMKTNPEKKKQQYVVTVVRSFILSILLDVRKQNKKQEEEEEETIDSNERFLGVCCHHVSIHSFIRLTFSIHDCPFE